MSQADCSIRCVVNVMNSVATILLRQLALKSPCKDLRSNFTSGGLAAPLWERVEIGRGTGIA